MCESAVGSRCTLSREIRAGHPEFGFTASSTQAFSSLPYVLVRPRASWGGRRETHSRPSMHRSAQKGAQSTVSLNILRTECHTSGLGSWIVQVGDNGRRLRRPPPKRHPNAEATTRSSRFVDLLTDA